MSINYISSHNFVKKWSKLNDKTKKKSVLKINLFLDNPHQPVLKTHKLTGKLKDYWAFSIEYNLRIMFRFVNNKTVEFIDIGTHSIYR